MIQQCKYGTAFLVDSVFTHLLPFIVAYKHLLSATVLEQYHFTRILKRCVCDHFLIFRQLNIHHE